MEPGSTFGRAAIFHAHFKCQSRASVFAYEQSEERLACITGTVQAQQFASNAMEGPILVEFDAVPAIRLWAEAVKSRRPTQSQRKYYRQGSKKEGFKTLTDLDASDSDLSEGDIDAQDD